MRTVIETQVGCPYGHAAQERVDVLRQEAKTGKILATDSTLERRDYLTMDEMATILDGAVRIEKFLGSCAVCHGRPEDAPSSEKCPLAMKEFDIRLDLLAADPRKNLAT